MTTAVKTRKPTTPQWARKLGLNFAEYKPTLVTATPEVIEKLLALNTENRTLDKTNVAKMVKQIESGRFNTRTSNAIGISTAGCLTDGQHRLTSFKETGITAELVVVTGCDPMAVLAPNAKPRSLAEFLKQHDYQYATVLAPMVKTLYEVDGPAAYDSDGEFKPNWTYGRSQAHITDSEFLDYLQANPIFPEYAKLGAALYNRLFRALPARFLGAFAYFVDHHTDESGKTDREFFFDRLADGIGLEDGSPILALREVLSRRKEDGSEKFAVMQGKFIKAWNAYREGKTIGRGRLTFKAGGATPDVMPAVI